MHFLLNSVNIIIMVMMVWNKFLFFKVFFFYVKLPSLIFHVF